MCNGFGQFTCKDFDTKEKKDNFVNCDLETMRKCHDIYFEGKPTQLEL